LDTVVHFFKSAPAWLGAWLVNHPETTVGAIAIGVVAAGVLTGIRIACRMGVRGR
jgi:hypothetical protein